MNADSNVDSMRAATAPNCWRASVGLDIGPGPKGRLFRGALVEVAKLRQPFGLDVLFDRLGLVERGDFFADTRWVEFRPARGEPLGDVEALLKLRQRDVDANARPMAVPDDRLAIKLAIGEPLRDAPARHAAQPSEGGLGDYVFHC